MPRNKETSGKTATRTGGKLERFVEAQLKGEGYTQVKTRTASLPGVNTFAKAPVVGKTIYGTIWKPDYLCWTPTYPQLIIECKWQQVGGSVDEKYPFLVANIRKIEIPTIIVADGGGMKEGAVEWMRSQIDGKTLLGVYTMTEFQRMVNDQEIL
jgi:hypothetical protein